MITTLFVLLVFYAPSEDKHIWFITYPANINALVALVSFGVSGIYLAFSLTVLAAIVARARGWVPEGSFQLGRWGWPVCIIAALYLGLMLVNVVAPTGLTSARGYFNLDWITLLVIFVIAVVGACTSCSPIRIGRWSTTCTTSSSPPVPKGTAERRERLISRDRARRPA